MQCFLDFVAVFENFRANIKPQSQVISYFLHAGRAKPQKWKQTEIWSFNDCANPSQHTAAVWANSWISTPKVRCKPNSEKRVFFPARAGRRRKSHESMATKSISLSLIRSPRSRRRHTLTVVGSPSHLCNNIGKRECVCLSVAYFICVGETPLPVQTHHIIIGKRARGAHTHTHTHTWWGTSASLLSISGR